MSRGCCKCSVAWWRSRVKLVTVEPILFLYMFAAVLSDPTQQALVYHKVCLFTVPDANNTSKQYICDNLENETNRDVEKEVQTVASHWFLYIALCFEIPSILIAFTYGSLSDHFSRKVTLVAPVIGQMIAISNWIANSMYPEAPMGFLLIGPLISGCFGGWVTLLVGCMSYISDISTRENRTGRIAVAEFVIAFPISLGLFISGAYRDATNVQTVFSTTLVLYFFVILYTVIRIKEPEGRTRITATWKSVCVNVLSPMSIKNTFKTVFRKREFNRRKQLAVLFLCLFLGILSTQPSWSLAYLYTKKYPLSWSTTMYGINAGYTIGIKGLANLLINPLLKKRCKMRDTSIMIMSLVTNACGEMLFGFSTHTWMVFMVPIVSIFGDAKITCQRALMSTMVESSELGQMFAIFGSLQSASNLVASFTYQYLYPLTLNFWSGFCFFMGASLSAIPLGLYIWVHRNIKKMEAYQMTDVNSSEVVVRDQDENGDSVWTVSTDREGASAPEFDLSVGINMKQGLIPSI